MVALLRAGAICARVSRLRDKTETSYQVGEFIRRR